MNDAPFPFSRPWAWPATALAAAVLAGCSTLGSASSSSGGAGPSGVQDIWQLASPSGQVHVTVRQHAGDAPTALAYRVALGNADGRTDGGRDDRTVAVPFSPLGITRTDADFTTDLRFTGVERERIDETYTLAHGKRRRANGQAREMTLAFENASGQPVEVVFRAYDEGAAFRYRFPESDAPGESGNERTVESERTAFRVPTGAVAWMQPYDQPSKYNPAYENIFRRTPAGRASPTGAGWAFPALFQLDGNSESDGGPWVFFTEAGLDGSYAGTHFALDDSTRAAAAPGALYRIAFPNPGEGEGLGDVEPASTLPWATPWRVVVASDRLSGIVESSLTTHVSPPNALDDTSWVQPGQVSWSWWSDSDSPTDPADLRSFVDLAADMNWRYSLVDAKWDQLPDEEVRALADYADRNGVELLYWYNSGGPNNTVTSETPRDRLFTEKQRQDTFQRLQRLGADGIKVDFFHSDKQERIRHYVEIMQDAADYELMVNFHGSTIPRGWHRTYPNMMTMEAVNGAERYKFSEDYPEAAPPQNAILPFTRNVTGPMDYTPVTFSDAANPHRTTYGHELALSVVFQSSLQHLADRADTYRSLPDAPKTFLKNVPASWDDIAFVDGYPARHAVLARRSGDAWYVGGISGTGEARTAEVDFSFLPAGASYDMTLIRDGADEESFSTERRTVSAGASLDVRMLPRGGFVMRLTPAE